MFTIEQEIVQGVDRQWPRLPCAACGSSDSEHVELWTGTGGLRQVGWAGCVDCWVKR